MQLRTCPRAIGHVVDGGLKLLTGVEDYGPTHSAAWCTVSDDARDLIEGRLRPRRAEIERSGEDGDPEDG